MFCTTTIPFCKAKTWNFLVTHYFLCRNCGICSPKILLLVFLFAFIFFTAAHFHFGSCSLLAASISDFLTAAMKCSCFSVSLITRSSSFSVIHVSVGIKNNVEKDSSLTFFLSKSPDGHAISRQIHLELPVVSYLF